MINSNNIAVLLNYIKNNKKISNLSLNITRNSISITKVKKNADTPINCTRINNFMFYLLLFKYTQNE